MSIESETVAVAESSERELASVAEVTVNEVVFGPREAEIHDTGEFEAVEFEGVESVVEAPVPIPPLPVPAARIVDIISFETPLELALVDERQAALGRSPQQANKKTKTASLVPGSPVARAHSRERSVWGKAA